MSLFILSLSSVSYAATPDLAKLKSFCAGLLHRGQAAVAAPSLPQAFNDYVSALRLEINRVTATPPPEIFFDGAVLCDWHRSSGGGCEALSFRLLGALSKFPQVKYRTVENYFPIRLSTGERLKDFVSHSFLSDSTFGAQHEVLIDPTYLQFIHGGESLGLPPIFVGTRAELEAIFARYSGLLKKQNSFRRIASIDVAEYAQKLYGYGRARHTRKTQNYFAGPERRVYP